MTIGRDELARIARENDAETAQRGDAFPRWLSKYDVAEDGLLYVAGQRGLRAALMYDGQEGVMSSRVPVKVDLSEIAKEIHALAGGVWIDGFAVGLKVARPIELLHPNGGHRG